MRRHGHGHGHGHGHAASVLTATAITLLLVVQSRAEASLDSSFGSGPNPGVVQIDAAVGGTAGRAVISLPDGSIVSAAGGGLQKYSPTGVLDASFGAPVSPGWWVSMVWHPPVCPSMETR